MTDYSTVYGFTVDQLNGEPISLDRFHNKVLLIVNTASECGFTPQMENLVDLKKQFADADFEILAFPSNDFGGQEPLEADGLAAFCKKFDTNFPMFDKIRVRGPYAHPLYQFLANKKQNGKTNAAPRWNFHKYLIDRNGKVADFYFPFTKPGASRIRKKIAHLLAQPAEQP